MFKKIIAFVLMFFAINILLEMFSLLGLEDILNDSYQGFTTFMLASCIIDWISDNKRRIRRTSMIEQVNHPSHYLKAGHKECIVEMEEKYGAEYTAVFCLMSAYKYLYRAGDKEGNPTERDINKAKWYFDYVNNKLLVNLSGYVLSNRCFENLYLDIKEMLENERNI